MKLVLTVDVDNDGVSMADERNHLTWSSVEIAPAVREVFAGFGFRVTWFLRADQQLREVYGRCDYLLREHASLWRSFTDVGDELAWHPHLYSRDETGAFVPERAGTKAAAQFREIHSLLVESGYSFRVVRIGEACGSNELADAMEGLRMRVDSTAIPGRRRDDGSRSFDWSPSPNTPYHPSEVDFRVPGSPSRKLWQVPMTTAPIRAPREHTAVARYLSLAYRPEIFAAAVAACGEEDLLVTILHADELLPRSESHPLYAFDMSALRENLEHLSGFRDVSSITMTELADILDRGVA